MFREHSVGPWSECMLSGELLDSISVEKIEICLGKRLAALTLCCSSLLRRHPAHRLPLEPERLIRHEID